MWCSQLLRQQLTLMITKMWNKNIWKEIVCECIVYKEWNNICCYALNNCVCDVIAFENSARKLFTVQTNNYLFAFFSNSFVATLRRSGINIIFCSHHFLCVEMGEEISQFHIVLHVHIHFRLTCECIAISIQELAYVQKWSIRPSNHRNSINLDRKSRNEELSAANTIKLGHISFMMHRRVDKQIILVFWKYAVPRHLH